MTLYKHKNTQPLRWLVAIVLFILAMTITFDDVHGFWVTPSNGDGTTTVEAAPTGMQPSPAVNETPVPEHGENTPPEVPEPATLILLGSGLAAMHLLRKRKA